MRFAPVLVLLAGSALLISASKPTFSPHEKAYYASASVINFVRPGLVTKILSADIATDGTVRAKIRITDPQGLPLDRTGVDTPGVVSTSFIVATIPAGQTQYTSYTTRQQEARGIRYIPRTSPDQPDGVAYCQHVAASLTSGELFCLQVNRSVAPSF